MQDVIEQLDVHRGNGPEWEPTPRRLSPKLSESRVGVIGHLSSPVAETWFPQSSVDKGEIDNTGVHTATVCRVNGDLYTKGLDNNNNMSQCSDAMSRQSNTTLGETKDPNAQTQVLDIVNESKAGYSLISFVQCVHSSMPQSVPQADDEQRDWWQGVGRAQSASPTRRLSGFSSAPSRVRHLRSAKVSRACFLGFNSCTTHPRIRPLDWQFFGEWPLRCYAQNRGQLSSAVPCPIPLVPQTQCRSGETDHARKSVSARYRLSCECVERCHSDDSHQWVKPTSTTGAPWSREELALHGFISEVKGGIRSKRRPYVHTS